MKPNLYLINGPLGAGKTTFLKYLLTQPGFTDARVIENEFASSSIDTHTLHEHQAEVRTIAGVCICCGSGEELVETLQSLKNDSAPVVIEATGVANSLKLIEKMAASDIFADYTLAHGVFVLDAAENTTTTIAEHGDELRAADTVLVSKTDLIDDARFATLTQQLTDAGVSNVQKVMNGQCDTTLLNRPSAMLAYFADFEGDLTPHDSEVNYTVTELGEWRVSAQKLEAAWPELQKRFNLRRLKGDGVAPDGTYWHIEATPAQCRVSSGTQTTPQLVWIGGNARELTLDDIKKACA